MSIDTQAIQNAGLSSAPAAKKKSQLGQADFLKLMTAQLSNQDPTKPLDSSQFMNQIAQFSTVQGIQDLQKSFSDFSTSMTANQALQAAALVGHSALAPADAAAVGAGTTVSGAVDLSQAADALTVNVYDASGQLVRQIPLGAQQAGLVNYQWDGLDQNGQPVPTGAYAFKAQATVGGKTVDATNLIDARVNSVTLGQNGSPLKVDLAGIGETTLAQLREIR